MKKAFIITIFLAQTLLADSEPIRDSVFFPSLEQIENTKIRGKLPSELQDLKWNATKVKLKFLDSCQDTVSLDSDIGSDSHVFACRVSGKVASPFVVIDVVGVEGEVRLNFYQNDEMVEQKVYLGDDLILSRKKVQSYKGFVLFDVTKMNLNGSPTRYGIFTTKSGAIFIRINAREDESLGLNGTFERSVDKVMVSKIIDDAAQSQMNLGESEL